MKTSCYYFYIRTGRLSKSGSEYRHWAWTKTFTSKEAVRKHFTHGSQTVRADEIFTAEQLVKKFGGNGNLKSVIEEAVNYSGKDGAR